MVQLVLDTVNIISTWYLTTHTIIA